MTPAARYRPNRSAKISRKKTGMIMKLLFALLFLCSKDLSANNYAQKITIVKKAVTLAEVFKSIEKQTNFLFFYDKDLVQKVAPIDVRIRNATLEEALAACLKDQALTYSIVQNTIVIQPKKVVVKEKEENVTVVATPPPVEINGRVVDKDNKPLGGVSVFVAGTRTGTSTKADGSFSLTVPDGSNVSLEISSVGYQTRTFAVANQTQITITLEEDVAGLNQIVVIGYGTVRKSDVTGSVGSVSRKELTAYPVTDAMMGLQGKTTGVRVIQNSGAPGAPVTVRVRGANSLLGSNEPLYVVDGFPLTYNPNSINPNDIESIEVLKDASATAIYGSRGANGVVMITTKKGRAGKAEVTFDSYYATQKIGNTIELMNAREFAELANERAANDGFPAYFTPAQISSFGEGTNWQDELFRTAPMQNHSVNVAGGNNLTQYSISGNYLGQAGIIEGSDLKRQSLRASLNQKISDKFNVSFNTTFTSSNLSQIDMNGQKGGTVLSAVLVAPPTVTPFDANGNYSPVRIYPFSPNELRNPLAMAKERKQKANTKYLLAGTAVTYEPVKNLLLRSSFGVENTNTREDIYSSRLLDNTATGQANVSAADWVNILNENTASYSKQIAQDHNINLLGGFTYQQFKAKNFGTGNVTGFPLDQLETNNLASGSVPGTPLSAESKWVIVSYLGRVNYSIRNTYLLTASIRADGSSRFGEGNKWGYFPSAAFAWRASNEDFIKNISAISDLKLRASWGVTGNTAVDPYQTLNSLNSVRTAFNDQLYIGYSPNTSNLANPDLKWETTSQVDLGLDLGLIQNRLYLTFDYYHKKTDDLLANSPLPTSSGYTTIVKNIGKIQNKGVELGLNAKLLNKAFKWDVNVNFSKNKSKVLQLSGNSDVFGAVIPQPLSVAVNLVRVGQPVGVFYGYLEDGLDATGAIKYKDLDGVAGITSADRTIIGDPNPDYFYNIGSTMGYKNFELNVLLQGVEGADIFNVNATAVGNSFYFGENQLKEVYYNHWSAAKPDASAKYPKISAKTIYRESDRFVEDGSFLRLKNVQLAYNFPAAMFGVKWVKGLQLYVSGQNLWTSTKYSWYDPEVNTRGTSIANQGNS
ncbi:MAG TPA: TonB-dependent receptor, partial [Chitinophagaceae bacterium]|nr:TonB-dependent receptor [Chitinophagaceae bacterium]